MATLNEKQAALFTGRNWGVIATIREDGSPQATPCGSTTTERTCSPAAEQQSGYVMVSGPATIVEDGALEHIKEVPGEDTYPYLGPGERRVIIQIRPERVDGYGAGG